MCQKKTKITYMNERLRDFETKMLSSDVSYNVSRENTKNVIKTIFEEIVVEKFPGKLKDTNSQIPQFPGDQ